MFEGTKKNAYTQIKRVFLLFLLAFFAYIHTFVEWYIVHIGVHSTKKATPHGVAFIFYLSRRLLDELLTVLDNDTLVVLIYLYTEEVVEVSIFSSVFEKKTLPLRQLTEQIHAKLPNKHTPNYRILLYLSN